MSELFSNKKLVNYFVLLETSIISITEVEKTKIPFVIRDYNSKSMNNFSPFITNCEDENIENNEKKQRDLKQKNKSIMKTIMNKNNIFDNQDLKKPNIKLFLDKAHVEVDYSLNYKYPEKDNDFDVNIESILQFLPYEHIYIISEYVILNDLNEKGKNPNISVSKEEKSDLKIERNLSHTTLEKKNKSEKKEKESVLKSESIKETEKSKNENFHQINHKYVVKYPHNLNLFMYYFPMCFTNEHGEFYYGHFLKVYEEEYIPSYETFGLVPKYLIFFSKNPYFCSFKTILEDIYINSVVNYSFNFKIEHLIDNLINKAYLPSNLNTQLSFSLCNKNYKFMNNPFHSEISLRLIFTYLSPDRIVNLYISLLMNSKIIIFYSQNEIFSPIILNLMTLLLPLKLSAYSMINNLNPMYIDLIDSPLSNLIIGINKKEFPKNELEEIYQKIYSKNIDLVYCDLDLNIVEISYNEEMRRPDVLPKSLISMIIEKIGKFSDIYDEDMKLLFKQVSDECLIFGCKNYLYF